MALYGCSAAFAGSAFTISVQRRKTKSAWTYIGFSHHRVPSLSKVAIRSAGATNPSPGVVTDRMNARMSDFALPSFQLPS